MFLSHSYATPGAYTASLTVFSPCGDITVTESVQAWNTGIPDVFEGLSVELSPNPSDGKFSLSLSGELAASYQLQLLDLQGKRLFEESLRPQGASLVKAFDFGKLPAGLYFLRLSDGARTGSLKLVIK